MKIKFFYGLILILTSLSLGAEPAESSLPRPKLVVGIVVDQMRWDYLYRYYDRYGDRGFKRLLKEGFTCENTQLNYLPAFTAVGHTCIYTGSVPSVTGIAANDFYIEKEKKKLNSTISCPYCGSINVKKIFFGGFAQKQWHCNNCRSDF